MRGRSWLRSGRNTGRGWSWLRSGGNTGRGWSWLRSGAGRGGEEEEGEGGDRADIKSNNPHLTGGEIMHNQNFSVQNVAYVPLCPNWFCKCESVSIIAHPRSFYNVSASGSFLA